MCVCVSLYYDFIIIAITIFLCADFFLLAPHPFPCACMIYDMLFIHLCFSNFTIMNGAIEIGLHDMPRNDGERERATGMCDKNTLKKVNEYNWLVQRVHCNSVLCAMDMGTNAHVFTSNTASHNSTSCLKFVQFHFVFANEIQICWLHKFIYDFEFAVVASGCNILIPRVSFDVHPSPFANLIRLYISIVLHAYIYPPFALWAGMWVGKWDEATVPSSIVPFHIFCLVCGMNVCVCVRLHYVWYVVCFVSVDAVSIVSCSRPSIHFHIPISACVCSSKLVTLYLYTKAFHME